MDVNEQQQVYDLLKKQQEEFELKINKSYLEQDIVKYHFYKRAAFAMKEACKSHYIVHI